MLGSASRDSRLLILFFLLLYAVVVLRNAWVCDDAYISFRVVDNVVNGYGLRWNVAERVQAFTHPLWVFVLIPFYAITGEVYFTVVGLSMLLSIAAVAVFAFGIARSSLSACLGILALTLSDAFVDFSTSGLENPLSFFLMALFLYVFLRRDASARRLFILSMIASLAAVNRLDTILLYIPPLAYAFWQVKGRRAIRNVVLGFMPLFVWELFSLMYYGFPFPNTAYAKLNLGVDSMTMVRQGVCYCINTINVDPVTTMFIAGALVLPLLFRDAKRVAVALGIVLSVLYTVRIGGCFMSGRFFTIPVLMSIIVLAAYLRPRQHYLRVFPVIVVLTVGLTSHFSPIYSRADQGVGNEGAHLNNYIVDERLWYNQCSSLVNYDWRHVWPRLEWAYMGKDLAGSGVKVKVFASIGMIGYFAGPEVFFIDPHGLSDPLIARLPISSDRYLKPGHYWRQVPHGYSRSIELNRNVIVDRDVAAFYDKLKIVTQGDVFSLVRWGEILKFNLGRYDYLIDRYGESHMIRVTIAEISTPREPGTVWIDHDNYIVDTSGIEIDLMSVRHNSKIEFCRDHNDDYMFYFCSGGILIDSCYVSPNITDAGGLSISDIAVPASAAAHGYDILRIFPGRSDNLTSIGHIILIDD